MGEPLNLFGGSLDTDLTLEEEIQAADWLLSQLEVEILALPPVVGVFLKTDSQLEETLVFDWLKIMQESLELG